MKKNAKKEVVVEKIEQKEEQDVDMENDFILNTIDKLQEYNINNADIQKLKTGGICTIKGLLMMTRKEIINNIKGITDQKLDKMIEAANKIEGGGFEKGSILLKKRQKLRRISTGSQKLDLLLGGGIESQAITEVFGEFRTGKTQLGHTLCVTAQMADSNGKAGGKVAYIDTENTFRPERIEAIAKRFELDPDSTLDNIVIARAYTVDNINNLLMALAGRMFEEEFSLVIVDSIMAPFRVDFLGRGELSERQNVLGKTLSRLMKIAEQFNVAIYMTNQVMSDPGNTMAFGDTKKPIGGNIMAHASTTRLQLRKGKGDNRVCKIYDSPLLREEECVFAISEGGIIDGTD